MKNIKVSTENGVRTIMFSRPANRNAWTEVMREEFVAALQEASRDPNVRVVILTGDPQGRAFCAGMQLSGDNESAAVLAADVPEGRPVNNSTFRDGGGVAALAVLQSTKPVICAMNGPAVGVGMTLACACDMRVAAKDAKMGFVFTRRGIACESLSSWILPKLVGLAKANELVLTGRIFKPQDAPEGLFNYVVPEIEVMAKATELAREIADNTSPIGVALSRFAMLRNFNMSPEQAHLIESRMIHHLIYDGADFKEGAKSFLEKRQPRFTSDPFKDLPEFYPWWLQIKTHPKL